jgi:hypothetical protein
MARDTRCYTMRAVRRRIRASRPARLDGRVVTLRDSDVIAVSAVTRRARLLGWIAAVRDYWLWQSLLQLLTVATALLLVNLMDTHEFAFYTLATAATTFLLILCDLGITNSLAYFRREVALAGGVFDRYLVEATRLRRILLLAAAPVFLAVFGVLSTRNGFPLAVTLGGAALALGAAWYQTTAAIAFVALRLDGRNRDSYRAETVGAVARLVAAVVMAVTSTMLALVALTANALGFWLAARAGSRAQGTPASRRDRDRVARRDIVGYVMPGLPAALYFSFQATIIAGLSAIVGQPRTIAEVGALGRLGLVIGVLVGFVGAVVIPRLAVVVDERLYRQRYFQYGAALAVCAVILVLAAAEWPRAFLFLLGPRYGGLEAELFLTVSTSAATLLGAYAGAINQARGWMRRQPVALLVFAAGQLALLVTLDLGTTAGILRFGLASAVVGALLQATINAVGFWRPAWVRLSRAVSRTAAEAAPVP